MPELDGQAGQTGQGGQRGHGWQPGAGTRIWVVPQLRDGRVTRVSWEALAAAGRLAAALAGSAPSVLSLIHI